MIERIKNAGQRFLIVAAVAAVYSGFTVLADASDAEIYEVSAVEADELPVEKPVYRCPNIVFAPIIAAKRASCHQTKKEETEQAQADKEKKENNGL